MAAVTRAASRGSAGTSAPARITTRHGEPATRRLRQRRDFGPGEDHNRKGGTSIHRPASISSGVCPG